MTELLAYLNSIYPLPDGLVERLQGIIKEKRLNRKDYLLKAGKVCQNIYFIRRGLLRCYYFKETKEISAWFMKEGDICIAVESFFEQRYSNENIQALEDSVVEYISHRELQDIYHDFPAFNFIGRVLTEKYYLLEYRKVLAMWMQRAQDRYKWFQNNFPDLTQRVPAKYLASYIGMTQTMLSRLKGKRVI
jgi:CRP-like cAMP-binding protein